MKRVLSFVFALIIMLSFGGCSNSSATSEEPSSSSAGNAKSDETPEMRIVQGDDGSEVEIPYTITKAAPLIGAFAQMTEMLTVGEGKIAAAATDNISDYFKQVFPDYEESNPNNYDASSVEDLIAAGAQVCYGPTSILSEEQLAQLKEAGIAYVPIDNIKTVEGMSNAFLIIGEILGEDEYTRAQEFVDYYQGNIDLCKERTTDMAEEEKITLLSLFYSADTYATINGGDICSEYVEAAGAVNVSKEYSPDAGSNNLTVDAEQIVAWNPQFIMTSNQEGKEAILNDPALATVEAVKNNNVHVCPYGVYLWSVRSGEGSMLPLWLGTQLYPELFSDVNMESVVKEFFNNWYNYDISEEEIQNTLNGDNSTSMVK